MVYQNLEKLISQAVSKCFCNTEASLISFEIPRDKNHGDYSTSIALKIAKNNNLDPEKVAHKIVNEIKNNKDIDKIEVIKPGFINFFLSNKLFENEIIEILEKKDKYGSSEEGKNKTILIDYSSPNIAKSFGIGHLRSTIIGHAIYNIYKFRGWKCIGDNHLGDWGTQFGKLIYQIKEKKIKDKKGKEKKEILDKLTIKDLETLYVDFHKEAQKNPELEDKGRYWFEKLESGDEQAKEIWQLCVDISKKEFNKIYKILGVEIDYCLGESFYSKMTDEIIDELQQKKIIKKSENALIIDFKKELPTIIAVKSDNTTTYLIRDLAAIKYRINKWNPDFFVYEVGVDQSLYFKQLFKTVELLGWQEKKSFIHIAHGLVRWPHGKFSTRKGETIHLQEILEQAIEKSITVIDQSKNISAKEKKEIAHIVGIGAVKYNDLSQHYQKDIIFDWQKILNLAGNSGPYIQYTFTRCQSVLKKADFSFQKDNINNFDDKEKEILRELIKFKEIIKEAADSFSPNIICNFLFQLSQSYNFFYNNERIIQQDDEIKKRRLVLTAAVSQVIKNGLSLLAIGVPPKM